MDENKKTLSNPLQGIAAILVFVGLVLAGAVVAFLVCAETTGLEIRVRLLLLEIFTIGLAYGWFAFSASEDIEGFFGMWVVFSLIASPMIAMAINKSVFWFWISLVIAVAMAFSDVFKGTGERKNLWRIILYSIYIVWVVAGIIITLGNTSFFPYARAAVALAGIHPLLDARYLVSTLLLLLLVIRAALQALRSDPPDIPSLRTFKLRDVSDQQTSLVKAVFQPFVEVLNVILHVLCGFANLVWRLIATVTAYIFYTGVNFVNHFITLLKNITVWRSIIRAVITFAVICIFALGVVPTSSSLYFYMTNATLFSLSLNAIVALAWVSGFFLLTFFSILALCVLWEFHAGLHGLRDQAIKGGGMIIIASAFSSGIMYGLARIKELGISGFDSLGLIALLVLVVFGVAILFVSRGVKLSPRSADLQGQ